jgi:hypothetical protein
MDWVSISSLATAGGTLVLAVATFASVRSANRAARSADRAARIAERSLLVSLRPLLVNSRLQDAQQKISFVEGNWHQVAGGRALVQASPDVIFMAVSVRNVGSGLAVLHGWHVQNGTVRDRTHPELEDFTSQIRDIYVAPGDVGFWQGALRDPAEEKFGALTATIDAGQQITLHLLYGDYEGGQRVISQFNVRRGREDTWLAAAVRHFNVDRPDPR